MTDDSDFGNLMSRMGVQPLKSREGEKRPPRRRILRDAVPESVPPTAETATPPVVEEAAADSTPPAVEETAPDPTAPLVEALSEAQAELAQLKARIAELEGELRQPPGETALVEMWRQRGVRGADEVRRVVQSLGQERTWHKLEAFLRLDRPGSVERLLGNQLVLLCSDNCATGEGFAVLEVEAARCEACGGYGLNAASKGLSEALLLQGIRHVNVIGGSLFGRRLLRGGLDPRVDLTPMAGSAFANTTPPVQEEDRLWIAWTGCPGDPAEGAWTEGGPLVVESPSVAGLFKDVIRHLEGAD